jgi:hypothetical protein
LIDIYIVDILQQLTRQANASSITDMIEQYGLMVLDRWIRPHFVRVHPGVHPTSGRATLASQRQLPANFFETQPWKTVTPDCIAVLHWLLLISTNACSYPIRAHCH